MKKLIAIFVLVVFSEILNAANFDACSVVDVRFGEGVNNGHVKFDCNLTGLPSCATATDFVAFDRGTDTGKQFLAMFTSALAASLKVTGNVKSSCPTWQSNVASLSTLIVHK